MPRLAVRTLRERSLALRRRAWAIAARKGCFGLRVALRVRQAAACMQYDDCADACAPILYEIKACIRKKLLQSGRPILERDRFQEASRRVAVGAETTIPDSAQRALGCMKDSASTIEQQAFFAEPHRSSGKEVAQQLFVVLPDRLCKDAFNVMAHRNCQSEAL